MPLPELRGIASLNPALPRILATGERLRVMPEGGIVVSPRDAARVTPGQIREPAVGHHPVG